MVSIKGISLVAVNCDDQNDLRKYLKKSPTTKFHFLCDPKSEVYDYNISWVFIPYEAFNVSFTYFSVQFIDQLKCQGDDTLYSVLIFIDVKTCRILKVSSIEM
jgi:hypothetical protein